MNPEKRNRTSKSVRSQREPVMEVRKSPALCAFALSPPFQPVLATSRRPDNSTPDRRRSLPRIRPRFKRKRSELPLLHYLTGGGGGDGGGDGDGERHGRPRRQTFDVEDVLATITQVWKTAQEPSPSLPTHMDRGNRFRKISCNSSGNSSPILLRRRLSAPEIVMRKHTLALQRLDSQDSDGTQSSDVKSCQFRNELSLGSDNSLNWKRDSSFMRKSTLLRRLWSNSKPQTETSLKTSNDFSFRSTQSTKSSPRTSPKHRKMELPSSPNRVYDVTQKTTTETDFETTVSLDNSDSAFSNSRSYFTGSSNSGIQKMIVGSSETCNEDENRNSNSVKNTMEEHSNKNTETQTMGTTNVNVISNVQLSKTTLDIIYKQVLNDVQDAVPDVININTLTVTPEPKRISVQQVPSFYLNNSNEVTTINHNKHDQMLQYMVSNVGTGSSYSKPAELPHIAVPRFSAYPRTASMEVNTSSADSTDKESDTISLVDSLEDPQSPRIDFTQCVNKHDDKLVRGSISSLLPDNSDNRTKSKNINRAFYIPIETDVDLLEKAVSEHLPEKVRERLSRRQMELKNKATSPRSDSNYVSSSDSHRFRIDVADSSGNRDGNAKLRKRTKPLFPTIQTTRKIRIDSDLTRNRKLTKNPFVSSNSSTKSKTQTKTKSKLSPVPVYTTKNEYHYDNIPNRIYHKTELNNANKRIEILEIMECIDITPEKYTQHSKGKSRIPVLIHPKLPKLNQQKPTFLEVEEVRIEDPKIDQLIANILIDTLNQVEDSDDAPNNANKVQKPKDADDENKLNRYCTGNKYQQRFEVIPEERLQTSSESNNNYTESNDIQNERERKEEVYKGKAALVKDDNLTTVPQGWITFYMLQKSQGSPDENTSDEGKAANESEKINEEEKISNEERKLPKKVIEQTENSDSSERSSHTDVNMNATFTLPQLQTKYKHKTRNRNSSCYNKPCPNQTQQHGWTVTVTGTGTNSDFAPNLEMKLNFPQTTRQNPIFDTGNTTINSENIYDASSNENDKSVIGSHRCKLPNINKERTVINKGKRTESFANRNEPRHTKTSSTRMALNRAKQLPLLSSKLNLDDNVDFNAEERQLEEFLKRFPHFLSVTGSAIYQDRRPRIYAITEKDIVRYGN